MQNKMAYLNYPEVVEAVMSFFTSLLNAIGYPYASFNVDFLISQFETQTRTLL